MVDLTGSAEDVHKELTQVREQLYNQQQHTGKEHTGFSQKPDEEQDKTHTHTQTQSPLIFVGNKLDKAPPELLQDLDGIDMVLLSALNKENLDTLKACILKAVMLDTVNKDQTLVTSMRHYQSLKETDRALSDVLGGVEQGVSNDLLALDIRNALHHLGEITGEITTDDLL
jgi:tRNA U34 5-carboxymethylaminomethyl modifying GTPase MnmE/TrmE